MKPIIDLRSDTVTKPTDAMRKAMANAEVGDDVFGEDPTVNRLQERVAELLGKPAALFVPSGTMANQICLAAQTRHGDEIILDADAHLINYESGAPALLSGLLLRTVPGERGHVTAAQIDALARTGGMSHYAPQTLVAIENTHNRSGGTVYSFKELASVKDAAHRHGMTVHLDGARLWNAAVAHACRESDIAKYGDSVSVCFSKGLGAPAGSAVAGDHEFIERAHRYRKAFGGGMRQSGIIAAGALHALEHHRERLIEDHNKAKHLADLLRESRCLMLDEDIQTNILIVGMKDCRIGAVDLAERCAEDGVLFFPERDRQLRLVTHMDVDFDSMTMTAKIIMKHLQA